MPSRYQTPIELLRNLTCPQGHSFSGVTTWPDHATCECNVCMKAWRATWTGDYWRLDEIILPNPDGDKPIDIPPLPK